MQTTSRSLYALFGLWIRYPDIQRRAREEVDKVLKGRRPTLSDKENMPYTGKDLCDTIFYG